jgi:hypothetical protein
MLKLNEPESTPERSEYELFVASNSLDIDKTLEEQREFMARHDAEYLVDTWINSTPEIAPEDEETPIPSDWSDDRLNSLESDPDDAKTTFFKEYPYRLGPEARDRDKVHKIMREKGVRAFVSGQWEGITGIESNIKWKKDMPDHIKPKARPINPRLYENAHKEFRRLCTYIYEPHDGPIASPMVVAPKATNPFIRICGDYRVMNEWMEGCHHPIPNVQQMLHKLKDARYFIDLDLTNAFHQIRLHPDSASKLSLTTPWGQFKPRFLPEGCKPGSHQLQKTVADVFKDLPEDKTILAFDNLLLMAQSMEEAEDLLEQVLDICNKRNVVLKLSKSNIIVKECVFFSYKVHAREDDNTPGYYCMADQLKEEIKALPFPQTTKRARSFVGSTVYYSGFIPNYSTLMAPIMPLAQEKFDWKNTEAVEAAKLAFEKYKKALEDNMLLAYPDFDLPWTLRTDASIYGVGAVLFQTRKIQHEDGSEELRHEPLFFLSKKFSDAATRWSTIEQECYAIYYALQKLEWYLMFKPIVIETDHRNLQWMEQSSVAKIVRWRIYIQQFTTMIKHVAGAQNKTADWLSRLFVPAEMEHLIVSMEDKRRDKYIPRDDPWGVVEGAEYGDMIRTLQAEDIISANALCATQEDLTTPTPEEDVTQDFDIFLKERPRVDAKADNPLSDNDMLKHVHNARQGHLGVKSTWMRLKDLYPGHEIPYAFVDDYILNCPVCQKFRLNRGQAYYSPLIQRIPAKHLQSSIGIDLAHMTQDSLGNRYILIVVNHFSKLTHLYPIPDKEDKTIARCLIQYYSQYGIHENIRLDQGSEFTGTLIDMLHRWLGVEARYSLVNRSESSGAERSILEVRRHILAIMHEDEEYEKWSSPEYLSIVQHIINDTVSAETGFKPFHLHYGSAAATYHSLPEFLDESKECDALKYLRALDLFLQRARSRSAKHLRQVQADRMKNNPILPNRYQPGDLIFFNNNTKQFRDKMKEAKHAGPYIVDTQSGNTIICRHCVLDTLHNFHLDEVSIFAGNLQDAQEVARFDKQQAIVSKIINHTGASAMITDLRFTIQFRDGTIVKDRPLDSDLQCCQAFYDYADLHPYLQRFMFPSTEEREKFLEEISNKPFPEGANDNATVYIDLQMFNTRSPPWYDRLNLPGFPDKRHFVKGTLIYYGKLWKKVYYEFDYVIPVFTNMRAGCSLILFHEYIRLDLPADAILIDKAFAKAHPQVLSSSIEPPNPESDPNEVMPTIPQPATRRRKQPQ